MADSDWKSYIAKAKENYYKIGTVSCPAFSNDKVHLNQQGFRHLLIKYGSHRSHREQKRRLNLIPMIRTTISSCKSYSEYREVRTHDKPLVQFWSLTNKTHGQTVIVIIRQVGEGRKHFYSIMNKIS